MVTETFHGFLKEKLLYWPQITQNSSINYKQMPLTLPHVASSIYSIAVVSDFL